MTGQPLSAGADVFQEPVGVWGVLGVGWGC